jgi:general secretion pathway protein C
VFGARALSHFLEAKYLSDPDHAPVVSVSAPTPAAAPTKPVRTKDGLAFAQRDMFCSECTPAVAVATDPGSITTTTLPLVLVATNVNTAKPEDSYASLVNTTSQMQGAYSVGDPIPGATGKLKAIHQKYIEFENNGHTERLVLAGAPPPAVVAQVETKPEGETDELQAAVDNGIKSTGENSYEIDKSLVEKILANPMGIAKGARVVPSQKNGKPDGFKLYAIRPSSAFAKLGLTNGDTLLSINGFELTSADKALEVYTKLREATSLQVTINRRGKDMTLNYSIR